MTLLRLSLKNSHIIEIVTSHDEALKAMETIKTHQQICKVEGKQVNLIKFAKLVMLDPIHVMSMEADELPAMSSM